MNNDFSRRTFMVGGAKFTAALGILNAMWQPVGATQAHAASPTANPASSGSYRVSPDYHLLKRISFGPTPAELARVAQIGRAAYIEEQLNYQHIHDRDCDLRLVPLASLNMDNAQLRMAYPGDSENPPNSYSCSRQLWQAAIIRAVYSQRQLYEVMVDFWTNHFNINQYKDDCIWYKTSDDRRVIRAHALGKFRDLLIASAHSPAMLYYLDNAYSSADSLNENYGREIMELHTLGVEGGYSQQDVRNVARAFSGWSIDDDDSTHQPTYEFYFNPDYHDTAAKTVLGQQLAAGRGIEDGDDVLNILARHPSTAHHIASKLCVYFIADQPPASIVNAVAATFIATDGDIKAMVRQILLSPEFAASAGQKLRTPFRYVAASIRAMGGATDGGDDIQYGLDVLSQPLFQYLPPTGYPNVAGYWISTDGLLNRWKHGIALLNGGFTGTSASVQDWINRWQPQSSIELLTRFEQLLFNGNSWPLYNERLAAIIGEDPQAWPDIVPLVVGLMLAAPEFQLM